MEVGNGEAKIVEDQGLTKMIEVVPLQVGTVQLNVLVSFVDGGLSTKTLQLDVVPGYTGVKTFHLDQGFSTIPLELTDSPAARQHWMYPEVKYDQLDYSVKLRDSSSVTIVVDQPEDNPVIQLDSNGMVIVVSHPCRIERVKAGAPANVTEMRGLSARLCAAKFVVASDSTIPMMIFLTAITLHFSG